MIRRTLTDNLLKVILPLPAAAATATSASIDIGPGWKGEDFEVELLVPALPALVEAKTVTITFKHSDTDVAGDAVAISELATLVVTGGVGNGADAATRRVRLPSGVKRYLFITAAVLTGGGDNTAVSVTMQLLL